MTFLSNLIADPLGALVSLTERLPAILIALILHEMAHGFMAYRLGDPTAKLMGRLSFNPKNHLDPVGTILLIVAGFGWAKPVPINPHNFKHPRRDDLLVSLAGIAANLIIFAVSLLIMQLMMTVAFARVPEAAPYASELYKYAYGMRETLIDPGLGRFWGYIYAVLSNLAVIDLYLAAFNLIPVPPLDGYHVLNDLILKRDLFAPKKVALIGQGLLLVLVLTGSLNTGLSWIVTKAFSGAGAIFATLAAAVGLV